MIDNYLNITSANELEVIVDDSINKFKNFKLFKL